MQHNGRIMKCSTRALMLAALALLMSCATTKIPLASKAKMASSRVGVVSLLGTDVGNIYNGVTVWGNEATSSTVPEWGIDNFNESTLIAGLKAKGYDVSEVSIEDIPPSSLYHKLKGNTWATADRKKISELARQQGFSAVVAVTRSFPNSEDPIEAAIANGSTASYGVLRKSLFGVQVGCAYSFITVLVIDSASEDTTGSAKLPTCAGGFEDIPEWKDDFNSYTDQEREEIRMFLTKRLKAQIEDAILKLQF